MQNVHTTWYRHIQSGPKKLNLYIVAITLNMNKVMIELHQP